MRREIVQNEHPRVLTSRNVDADPEERTIKSTKSPILIPLDVSRWYNAARAWRPPKLT
jgi:hypothetical protein